MDPPHLLNPGVWDWSWDENTEKQTESWRESLDNAQSLIPSQTRRRDSATSSDAPPRLEKRSRRNPRNSDSEISELSGFFTKRKIRTDMTSETIGPANSKKQPPLACPFYKRNAGVHIDCMRYKLHRIKDVKQHIQRRHSNPEFYCARCFEIFPTSEQRDFHARHSLCACKRPLQFEGISATQRKLLSQSLNRSHTIEQQWFGIWDIVFPGQPKPSTVYLGNYVEETVSQLRAFWEDKKGQVCDSVFGDGAESINREHLDRLVTAMLNHFQCEISGSDVETDDKKQPAELKHAPALPRLTSYPKETGDGVSLADLEASVQKVIRSSAGTPDWNARGYRDLAKSAFEEAPAASYCL